MKIFLIGVTGGVGRRLHPLLTARGHVVRALVRRAEPEAELRAAGVEVVAGDLTALSVEELATQLEGCDVLIFSAGAGGKGAPERTIAVDGEGLEKSALAAERAGVARFLLVSAFPEAGRARNLGERFELYMRVKKAADAFLVRRPLDWVILRPGTLTNEDAGPGTIALGLALEYGTVARADVAATLATLVETPALSRVILELTEGPTPVADAVAAQASPRG